MAQIYKNQKRKGMKFATFHTQEDASDTSHTESWHPVFKRNCLKTWKIQTGKFGVKLPDNAAKITIELLLSKD